MQATRLVLLKFRVVLVFVGNGRLLALCTQQFCERVKHSRVTPQHAIQKRWLPFQTGDECNNTSQKSWYIHLKARRAYDGRCRYVADSRDSTNTWRCLHARGAAVHPTVNSILKKRRRRRKYYMHSAYSPRWKLTAKKTASVVLIGSNRGWVMWTRARGGSILRSDSRQALAVA